MTKFQAFASSVAAALLLAVPAYAGTNSGNFRDGQTAAKAFCWPIEDLAFRIAGRRDPVLGDYDRAALQVGLKVEAVYGETLPASHRRAFRGGFEAGAKDCKRIIAP